MAQQRASGSRTLARGLVVIEAISGRADGATVAELCAITGLDRAVVHRLLGTLRELGYVRRDPRSRRFRLGVALVELGGQATRQLDVRRVAQAALRTLKDATRESTCLVVGHGADVVVVDRVEAVGGSGHTPLPVGARWPMPRLAHGRAVLAFLDHEPSAEPVGDAASEELAVLRQRGYSVGTDDIEPGLVEVAAPVLGADGRAVAALGVVAPATRLPDPTRLGSRVRSVAGEVSRRLGAGG